MGGCKEATKREILGIHRIELGIAICLTLGITIFIMCPNISRSESEKSVIQQEGSAKVSQGCYRVGR